MGRGAIGQAKEFKALQALTEQLNAAQQRIEESGKIEAAGARAAIQALADIVGKHLGVGKRKEQALSQQGLHFPLSAAADEHSPAQLRFSTAGPDTNISDPSALLAACTAWLPPVTCSDKEDAVQNAVGVGQRAMHLAVERFSTWLPTAASSTVAVEVDDWNLNVAAAAELVRASSCLPPTLHDDLASQVELSRVSTWLPPEPASETATILKSGERMSTCLLPTTSSDGD